MTNAPKIEITFDVQVIQTVTRTSEDGQVVPDSKTLAKSVAGPEETAALLEALAQRARGAKKAVGVSTLLGAFASGLKTEDDKRRAAGKPSMADEIRDLLGGGRAGTPK